MLSDVSKLKVWVQQVLPLVYDDSLSYYEVLAKVVAKLNEQIGLTNQQNEFIQNWSEQETTDRTTFEDKITADIQAYTQSIKDLIDDVPTLINVQQTTGQSTTAIMSQKAVTDELDNTNKALAMVYGAIPTIEQNTGTSTTAVMSQNAVTQQVNGLQTSINNVKNSVPSVVQGTGTSTTAVMSQNAVKTQIDNINTTINNLPKAPTVVQDTGTSTTAVMSQNAIMNSCLSTNYIYNYPIEPNHSSSNLYYVTSLAPIFNGPFCPIPLGVSSLSQNITTIRDMEGNYLTDSKYFWSPSISNLQAFHNIDKEVMISMPICGDRLNNIYSSKAALNIYFNTNASSITPYLSANPYPDTPNTYTKYHTYNYSTQNHQGFFHFTPAEIPDVNYYPVLYYILHVVPPINNTTNLQTSLYYNYLPPQIYTTVDETSTVSLYNEEEDIFDPTGLT